MRIEESSRNNFNYLSSRARQHYRSRGFLYAAYRSIAYFIYRARITYIDYALFDMIKNYRYYKKIKEESRGSIYALGIGRLEVKIDAGDGKVDIYWDGVKLTKGAGMISVVGTRAFKRYYSPHALWEVNKISSTRIEVNLRWPGFPVEQKWQVELVDEKNVKLDSWLRPRRKIVLAEKEVGLMLSGDYIRWINSYEEGEFRKITPEQTEWEDMKLYNFASKHIGVRSCIHNGIRRPAILIDFEKTKEDTVPKIRNSDYVGGLRAILAQMNTRIPPQKYSADKQYNIFSGKIKIIDEEKIVGQHIMCWKKRLHRERVPFNEGKLPMKYLYSILRPIEVLLVNLPWRKGDRLGVRAGSRWPHIKERAEDTYLPFPFFLAYTASLLLEHGISVRIIDAIAENIEDDAFVNIVNELEPMLLIAEVSTPSLKNDLSLLKQINKQNTKIAICGADFNIRKTDFLKENNFIDFVMVGEYEYTALELFVHMNGVKNLEGVPGLIYRENGNLKVNPSRPLIDGLDKLPWPLREQLPMERYMDAPGNIPTPSAQMWASRGCPFGCTFCLWPQLIYNGKRYRMRKAKYIVDEMEYLVKEMKFKSIYFDDDTFNINKENVLDICNEIKKRKLNIPWAIMARADTMDEEMLVAMKEAGLWAVKYGVESAEQKLLDKVCKNIDLKKAERMINFTKSLGIKMHLTFAFGLPGETKDTVKKSIDYAIALNPNTVQFSIMTPYPGTEYYKYLDARGYVMSKDWSDYDGASKSVIRTEHLSGQDLKKAKDEALRMWKKHKRRTHSFLTMPFDRELKAAFRNSFASKGFWPTLIKTIKYIINV